MPLAKVTQPTSSMDLGTSLGGISKCLGNAGSSSPSPDPQSASPPTLHHTYLPRIPSPRSQPRGPRLTHCPRPPGQGCPAECLPPLIAQGWGTEHSPRGPGSVGDQGHLHITPSVSPDLCSPHYLGLHLPVQCRHWPWLSQYTEKLRQLPKATQPVDGMDPGTAPCTEVQRSDREDVLVSPAQAQSSSFQRAAEEIRGGRSPSKLSLPLTWLTKSSEGYTWRPGPGGSKLGAGSRVPTGL